MATFSCRVTDAKLFQVLVEAVSVVISEGNILVTENNLGMRSMDPARVALVDFELPQEAFEDYSYTENLSIGISMDEVKEVIKRSKRGEALDIVYEVEKGRLIFMFSGLGPERRFSISTLDLEGEDTPMPSLEFAARIKLGSEMLAELVKDVEVVSDHIEFHSDSNTLKARATSDTREVEVKINKDDDSITDFNVREESRAVYTLRYLRDMARAARMADDVSIEFSKDMPLRLDFAIPNGGRLTYFLAPRIEEG